MTRCIESCLLRLCVISKYSWVLTHPFLCTTLDKEALIKQYQSELHSCKRQMSSELKRWKRWAQIDAENLARTYYENKYLMLSSQIEIAMAKLIVLETIVNKVQFVLDGGDMEKVKAVIFEPSIEMLAASKFQSRVQRSRGGAISASSPTSPSLSAVNSPSGATTPTMMSLTTSIQKRPIRR